MELDHERTMRRDLISGASAIVPYVCPKGYGIGLKNSYIFYFILLDLLILTNSHEGLLGSSVRINFHIFSLNAPHDFDLGKVMRTQEL